MDHGTLNYGLRKTVIWLNTNGFITVESGDGDTSLSDKYECDRDYPYVMMTVEPQDIIKETERLYQLLRQQYITVDTIGGDISIQASFDPANYSAVICLMGVNDEVLA